MPSRIAGAVGLDRGDNAALLAIEMLAISNEKLSKQMQNYREKMRKKALSK